MMIETPNTMPKTGDESFIWHAHPLNITLRDFWQWAYADLLNNAMRGILAEFLVMTALDIRSAYRQEWQAWDIQTCRGTTIEVKSSAYVQSWKQTRYSRIIFGIQPTQRWNGGTNTYSPQRIRQTDMYVFCVLKEQSPQMINPLDLDQWEFYVLATKTLNEHVGTQKTITLQSLLKLAPKKADYGNLKQAICSIEESILQTHGH